MSIAELRSAVLNLDPAMDPVDTLSRTRRGAGSGRSASRQHLAAAAGAVCDHIRQRGGRLVRPWGHLNRTVIPRADRRLTVADNA